MSSIVAISAWKDHVSTTCDFAERLVVVKIDQGCELSRTEIMLQEEPAGKLAKRIQNLDVGTLLCGTISKPLAEAITHAGINVIPYVSGSVDEVLAAYMCGHITRPRFLQPGCRSGARRRWRHNMHHRANNRGG